GAAGAGAGVRGEGVDRAGLERTVRVARDARRAGGGADRRRTLRPFSRQHRSSGAARRRSVLVRRQPGLLPQSTVAPLAASRRRRAARGHAQPAVRRRALPGAARWARQAQLSDPLRHSRLRHRESRRQRAQQGPSRPAALRGRAGGIRHHRRAWPSRRPRHAGAPGTLGAAAGAGVATLLGCGGGDAGHGRVGRLRGPGVGGVSGLGAARRLCRVPAGALAQRPLRRLPEQRPDLPGGARDARRAPPASGDLRPRVARAGGTARSVQIRHGVPRRPVAPAGGVSSVRPRAVAAPRAARPGLPVRCVTRGRGGILAQGAGAGAVRRGRRRARCERAEGGVTVGAEQSSRRSGSMRDTKEEEPMTARPEQAFLPFHRPAIDQEEIDAVVETLRSGWVTMGPKTRALGEAFAPGVRAPYAVAVSSATARTDLGLDALGVGPGDEVLVPTLTFTATAATAIHTGAQVRLVDCEPDTLNICPADAARKWTPRTKAIVPVHFAGHPCDMDPILTLAAERGGVVMEDAAHALPARYRGRPVGSLGELTVFSFYATKNLTTGEGGMVTTRDKALEERLRTRRLHGMTRDAWKRYTKD